MQLPPFLTRRRNAAALCGLLAVLVYANSLANGFAYDDPRIILENADLHSLETLPGAVFKPYWHGQEGDVELGLWRPTTTLLLGLQYAVAGEEPMLYHAVNVLGHGVATAFVVLLLAHLLPLTATLGAGVLFAVHPVHVEAVANVVGVAEVVGAALVMGALLVHLGGPSTWRRAAAVAALGALAFGAKESAATLPALIFLVDAARARLAPTDLPEYLRASWRTYAALLLVMGGMLVVRASILGSVASPEPALGGRLLLEIPRIWTLAEVWSHYVRLMVFPLDLASDYSPAVIPISIGWHMLNGLGVLLGLLALAGAWVAWRRPPLGEASTSGRAFGFGVLWFVLTIAPVANVFFVSGVLLAERTLYLPSVGAVAVLGWAMARLVDRRVELGVAAAALAVVLMGIRTWTRTPTWRDDGAVFEALIEQYPHSGRSQWLVGDIYMTQGRQSEGLRAYREAIPNLGAHYGLTLHIGRRLLNMNNDRGAVHLLESVRRDAPELGSAPALLGVAYTRMGEWAEAEAALQDATRLQPENPINHHLLATALTELGRYGEAAVARRTVIGMGEDVWQQWLWLADLEARSGNVAEADAALEAARVRGADEASLAPVDSLVRALAEGR